MRMAWWRLALALCCLAVTRPVVAADLHLRKYWFQAVDGEYSLVGVLSRDEEKGAVVAEIHLEAYRNGLAVGEQVHRFKLDETVRLFSIPLERDLDCYRVVAVFALDAKGRQVSATEDSQSDGEECLLPKPVLVNTLRPS